MLGATGDLAGRLLLPALAALHAAGELAPGFRLVGVGDQPWDDAQFAAAARAWLERHAPDVAADARETLLQVVSYRRADVRDAAALRTAVAGGPPGGDDPIAVYLALPTHVMADAVHALALAQLPMGSRIAVEKPFGSDVASAAALNALLARAAPGEGSGYRVDHTLGLPALTGLPRLTGVGLSRLEVLFEETLALEGRAAFYDRAGALRDVMQNHMIQ
ncbi:MAG: glucose-6-phosphate dehydrogenase, partial [Jatrophihabitantaceae bacterium]|nr:glucose-6-phosphate dehydrogenase [Jatrophihabitantaceae bacterium]